MARIESGSSSKPSLEDWGSISKSLVVEVRSPQVVSGVSIYERRLAEMIGLAIRHVTNEETDNDAWHSLLTPDDVIGLKFNSSGATGIGTNDPFVRQLVLSLMAAGYPPERIVLIEASSYLVPKFKTQPVRSGWRSENTDFGSGIDQFAAVLDQVTALINVPFLKANPIAGMSGCLKNLSHAMVRHPAFFHANTEPVPERGVLKPGKHCTPYVADIVGAPILRAKLRLHLMNALRTAPEPAYEPSGGNLEAHGGILAGIDPVAVDMVGLEILNQQRLAREQTPLAKTDEPLPQLRAAETAELGTWQPDYIEHRAIRA